MTIGILAAHSGTNAPTIRYYEDIGLLRRPDRTAAGRRVYGEADVRRLALIRSCRAFGLSIEEIRILLAIMEDDDRACLDARGVVARRLDEIRVRIRELTELEGRLTEFVAECDAACGGGRSGDCSVLESVR